MFRKVITRNLERNNYMTYSINTLKYTARKVVDINGQIFKVRRFTTDEQFRLSELQEQVNSNGAKMTTAEAKKTYEAGLDMFFNLFDDVKKAKEILKDISMQDLADMYKEIMENANVDIEQ